ncbi:hypothetical protein ACRQ5Q_11480 [Bradyrhizobium sp. PMVTL-01]|uniref:hypothetical protein n=1 Tax=Bradyrhizobium sp. PMVTL-01 TaxID=3434999 RepID=UPI003F708DF2
MMTSDPKFTEAYVWTWLPGQTKPVVAGILSERGEQLVFNYGRSYLERKDAIALYQPELPLRSGILPLLAGLNMPNCIRDAASEAWGRRVILNRKFGARGKEIDAGSLDERPFSSTQGRIASARSIFKPRLPPMSRVKARARLSMSF